VEGVIGKRRRAMKRGSATRTTSAVEAARKRERGPTLSEQRAELQRAELGATQKQQRQAVAVEKQPAKKQPAKKQPAKKQPAKQPAKKQKTEPLPKKGETTVSFSFNFLKVSDDEEESVYVPGEDGEDLFLDTPGIEANLESPELRKSEWKHVVEAKPAKQFTFMIRAPTDSHDGDELECNMWMYRTVDGKRQMYEMDNDMETIISFDDIMRGRRGNERKWKMAWSGFSPGWFEFEATLQRGNQQVKLQILRAGFVEWCGDDCDDADGYNRWREGYDFDDEEEDDDNDEFDDW
jgi:hypothetical protein